MFIGFHLQHMGLRGFSMARRKIGTAVVLIFIACVALFYGLLGENSYIAVQDNLDLFVAQFAMLKNEGIFFYVFI